MQPLHVDDDSREPVAVARIRQRRSRDQRQEAYAATPASNRIASEDGFKVNEWVVPPRARFGPDAYIALLIADVQLPERERQTTTLELSLEPERSDIVATATLRDASGPPLEGRQIDFSAAGGEIRTALTDAQGQAQVTYRRNEARPGDLVTATFAGDERYQASSAQASVAP